MSTPKQPIQDFSLQAWMTIEDAVQEDGRLDVSFTDPNPPSLTFDESNIFIEVDGIEALKQSMRRLLETERFSRTIYDHRYGIESEDLYGNDVDFVDVEIERRISECLREDDRIKDIHSFQKVAEKEHYTIYFTVDTIFGTYEEVVNFGFNPN